MMLGLMTQNGWLANFAAVGLIISRAQSRQCIESRAVEAIETQSNQDDHIQPCALKVEPLRLLRRFCSAFWVSVIGALKVEPLMLLRLWYSALSLSSFCALKVEPLRLLRLWVHVTILRA